MFKKISGFKCVSLTTKTRTRTRASVHTVFDIRASLSSRGSGLDLSWEDLETSSAVWFTSAIFQRSTRRPAHARAREPRVRSPFGSVRRVDF